MVEVVGEPAGELELGEVALERRRQRGGLGEKVLVVCLGAQLKSGRGVLELGASVVDACDVALFGGELGDKVARGVATSMRFSSTWRYCSTSERRDASSSIVERSMSAMATGSCRGSS
jgi:hypothetical protein